MSAQTKTKRPTAALTKIVSMPKGAIKTGAASDKAGGLSIRKTVAKKVSPESKAGVIIAKQTPTVLIRGVKQPPARKNEDVVKAQLSPTVGNPSKAEKKPYRSKNALPDKLKAFSGWPTELSEQEIDELIEARSGLFSTDYG